MDNNWKVGINRRAQSGLLAALGRIGIGALPIGALLGGWVARATGLRTPYFVSSALIALAAVLVHRVARSVD